jgi:hypothetical protein
MKSKKPIVNDNSMIPEGNRYRLTFRDGKGSPHDCEVTASNISTAVSENHDPSDLVKVERIDPETGLVLGGFYNE